MSNAYFPNSRVSSSTHWWCTTCNEAHGPLRPLYCTQVSAFYVKPVVPPHPDFDRISRYVKKEGK